MEGVATYVPFLAWTLVTASLVFTSILGAILAFHWVRYAFAPAIAMLSLAVYTTVSLILLSGMFTALAIFNASI